MNEEKKTDTNTPKFDLGSFNQDTVPEEITNAGNGSGSVEKKDEPVVEGSKSAPDKGVTQEETPKTPDKSTAESRLSDAQNKIREQAEQLKQIQAAQQAMILQAQQGKLHPKQEEVMSLLLDNLKKTNAPKEPTVEEISKKFNEVAEQDPFGAVMTVVNHVMKENQSKMTGLSQEERATVKAEIMREVQGLRENETIEGNLRVMANTPELQFNENFGGFKEHIWAQCRNFGMDDAQSANAIKSICKNPAQLTEQYNSFLFKLKGPDALAKITAAQEAKIAAKLAQNQARPGKESPPKKSNKDMVLEEVGPGFTDYFTH